VQKIGKQDPDFTGNISNEFSYKGIFASVLLDIRWGGYVASYTNLYARGYGVMESSLAGRNSKYGGLTFTSKYTKKENATFHDGVIPDGVFEKGTVVTLPKPITVIGADGKERTETTWNVEGMTYADAVKAGYVEPMHASQWHYYNNEWATFTINDGWFNEMKYIALRHITVGYTIPNRFTSKIGVSNLRLSLEAHNVRYLYNSLSNNLNPESMSGNSNNYMYYERIMTPFIASYNFTVRFNL
jgi:iron complex outermembrane receptor protein